MSASISLRPANKNYSLDGVDKIHHRKRATNEINNWRRHCKVEREGCLIDYTRE